MIARKTDAKNHWSSWLLLGIALLAVMGMVLWAAVTLWVGFPLDDAWIHQTYARNLAQNGEWAFIPGQPSAGSTAPLWSIVLAAGYLFSQIPYAWSFLLGGLSLFGLAWLGERIFRIACPQLKIRLPLAGLFLATEWHLAWAGASGMETALQAALIAACFLLVYAASNTQSQRLFAAAGAVCGLSVWVRPDGITLLGPVLLCAFLIGKPFYRRMFTLGLSILGFTTFFIPYLYFNHQIEGTYWPNTFYAKQAEYAVLLQTPLAERLGAILSLPMVGAGLLLLPGVLYFIWLAGRERRAVWVSMFLWWAGFSLIYAVRLPVVYQHGRYLIPAMSIFWLMGLIGTVHGLERVRLVQKWRRRVTSFVVLLIAAVNLGFYGLGTVTYAQDVAIIETEMVASAKWVEQNTPADALIAAHDIGALGYYGQRDLIDLAGLVSPEVIPFIRDESKLAEYLDTASADYLMTFPSWYPELIKNGEQIFTTGAEYSPAQGGDNMAVYRWEDSGK